MQLDLKKYELRLSGRMLQLEKIPMELLIFLVENKDKLVSREAIVERLWGKDVFLDTEQGINTAIRKIRLVLREDAEHPRFLQTVVGKGYRLVGPITLVGNGLTHAPAASAEPPVGAVPAPSRRSGFWLIIAVTGLAICVGVLIARNGPGGRDRLVSRSPGIHSIAVLPLENLTGDNGQEYLADGITDALTTDLAQIHSLRVISRTSAVHYQGLHKSLPEIAKELNVDAVVEGTVSRSGDRVRITAQLIHAPTDWHLWAESYERNLGDILVLQGEIALDIARQVSATLTPREQLRLSHGRPVSPEAQEAYLRGRYILDLRNNENLDKTPEYFQQAIEKDPTFAAAYAGLADCYLILASWHHVPADEVRARAREAITKALALDDNSSEAHASFAYYEATYERNLNGVEREFKRALELNPNNSDARKVYGLVLMEAGRFEEAIAEEIRALDLDPLAPHLHGSAGHVFYDAKQYDRAILEWRRALALDPSLHFLHLNIGWAYAHQGMHDEAVREWLLHWEHAPKVSVVLKKAYATSGYEGYLRAQLSGDFANAFRPERLSDYQSNYERAAIHAQLGELDNAFRSLATSVQQQDPDLPELLVDPDLEKLRSDPRFPELVRRCRVECGISRPF